MEAKKEVTKFEQEKTDPSRQLNKKTSQCTRQLLTVLFPL